MQEKSTSAARGLLAEVEQSARHSLSLAKDCIAAKLRESKITEEPSPVRMIQLAIQSATTREPNTVELRIEERLWPIRCEVGLVRECVEMLISRADRVSPSGAKVRISAANRELVEASQLSHSKLPAGRYVEVAINNGGPPLSVSVLNSILDLGTALSLGADIELSLASSVLDYFGGALSVTSASHQGTTAHLYIPEARENAIPTPRIASPFASTQPRSGKVLVVDDEEKIRVLLRRMLSHLNAEVALAEDGGEGVALYKAALDAGDPFDLVILDLTIPGGMGGREAIEEMIKLDPGVKGIVSSGYSQDPVMANYREHGFSAVMAKPYTFAQLKETVAPFLPKLPVG